MPNCVTCGDELNRERAEKYGYCTKRECRQRNAKALPIVAVGVNKAADQFVVLDERTEKEMASGRYKKVPETPASIRRRSRPQRVETPEWEPTLVPRSPAAARSPPVERGPGEPDPDLPGHGAEAGSDREEARREPVPRDADPACGHESRQALTPPA